MKKPQAPPPGRLFRKCPKCGARVRRDHMKDHLAKHHTPGASAAKIRSISRRSGRRPILKHPLPQPVTPKAKVFPGRLEEHPTLSEQLRNFVTREPRPHGPASECDGTLGVGSGPGLPVGPEQPTASAPIPIAGWVVRRKCPECDREMREDLLERHINIFHRYQQPVPAEGRLLPGSKPRRMKVLKECPSCGRPEFFCNAQSVETRYERTEC